MKYIKKIIFSFIIFMIILSIIFNFFLVKVVFLMFNLFEL